MHRLIRACAFLICLGDSDEIARRKKSTTR